MRHRYVILALLLALSGIAPAGVTRSSDQRARMPNGKCGRMYA